MLPFKFKAVLLLIIAFVIGFLEVLPERAAAAGPYNILTQQLNQIISSEPELKGAIAGISIRTSSEGKIIFEHNGDIRLRPASNLKLVTASAALSVLGPSYTFTTEIRTDGNKNGDKLNGSLYLKGKGDPTLTKTDFINMARVLRKKGIKKISGNIIGDDSWYDDVRLPRDLPWTDETTYYGAPVSALTASPTKDFDAGTVVIDVRPGKNSGEKAYVKMTPTTKTIKIINKTKTIASDGKKKIHIYRKHGSNQIIIKGDIPVQSKSTREWVAVWRPADYALDLFQQALRSQGIKIEGKVKTGITPKRAKLITCHHSIPLSQLLIPFMKLSNNGHAEVLVKEMGKAKKGKGSWEKGLEIVENELPTYGLNPKRLVIRDGSGVSHVNLISANQLSQLLYAVQRESWFPAFQKSLPEAGEKEKMIGGTLRNRLQNPDYKGRIWAKTGTISTVSSLSGYIVTKTKKKLIFSILLNNLIDEEKGKKVEDKIAECLANQ